MAVTVLTETSPSAPVLNGLAGSLIAVLDYCLVTTLGWTKAFSGSNLAAYKSPAGTNGFYLRVDDSGGQNARLIGYEAMTAVSAGTGPFPTDAQQVGGLYCYKSNAGSAAARPWTFISNGKFFYFTRDLNGVGRSGGDWQQFAFGDIISYKGGDAFNTMIAADISPSTTSTSSNFLTSGGTALATVSGHFMARAHTQIGASIACGKYGDYQSGQGSASSFGVGALPYPSAIDGQMHLSPVWVTETAGKRGLMPGLWWFLHPAVSLTGGDTFTGGGTLAGRAFTVIKCSSSNILVFETTDTWGT